MQQPPNDPMMPGVGQVPAPDDPQLQAILDAFTQGLGGGLPAEPEPILGGFWGGDPSTLGGPGGVPYRRGMAPVVYHEGDEVSMLSNMNTERLARLQDALVATGLVREVIPGRLDDNTVKGMQTLMVMGNREGVRWQEVLDGIVAAGGVGGGAGSDAAEFDPQPYLAPDYASIAQEVKGVVRDRLGRDPDQGELAQLTSEWMGYDRAAYDAEQTARRASFDAQTTPGTQSAQTIQSVDPAARFAEEFERRYANELDFVEDKEDAEFSRQVVESGTNTLSQMSRGG